MAQKKFKINPLLWLFYYAVKGLVCVSFRLFYSKTTIRHLERLRQAKRPYILVSNHPSTLMDPLNVAKEERGIVFFLANASLFKHWFTNWFFSTFYCIKIERPDDVKGRKIQNQAAFEHCDRFLGKQNGVLYIAAEGGSALERRIRRIKTGTARIALSAESKNNFDLGLTIVPVGISYQDPLHFRKQVYMEVAEPIRIADYQQLWQKDSRRAVIAITDTLAQRLQDTVVHTAPEEEDIAQLAEQLATMAQTDHGYSFEQFIQHCKREVVRLRALKSDNPVAFLQLRQTAQSYVENLRTFNLSDASLQKSLTWKNGLFVVLGFPFFVYGYINNFLAIATPAFVNKKMDLYPGYYPTVKVMVALLSVPFFYWLQSKLLAPYLPLPYAAWWYVLSLIPSGLFAWKYLQHFKKMLQIYRFKNLSENEKQPLENQRATMMDV